MSRKFEDKDSVNSCSLFLISFPTVNWLTELKQCYDDDSELQELLKKVKDGQSSTKFSMKGDLLFYKDRLYVPSNVQFITKLLHSSPEGGHSGVDKTLYKVRRNFFWKGLKRSVKEFIQAWVKVEQTRPEGLL